MTVPSLLILGTDVALAASPATPVQLAHGCLSAGYDTVIPATWGDELIAARALERLRDSSGPFIHCSCPLVARRLSAHGASIAPLLLGFVSPPVATAEYLRAVYAPTRPRITFAGGCLPSGQDSIDVWMSADELLNDLSDRGITLTSQPTEFDSVLPPDRRRFFSDPGGVPTQSALRTLPSPVELHEHGADDLVVEVAQRLLSQRRALLDVSPALGCSCSGVRDKTHPGEARARVRDVEPPRSFTPVVDHSVAVTLDRLEPLDFSDARALSDPSPLAPHVSAPPPRSPSPVLSPIPAPISIPADTSAEPAMVTVEAIPRRSPPGLARPVLGTMPHARTDAGRQLPRAYVARRRSSPRGVARQTASRSVDSAARSGTDGRQLRWIAVGVIAVAAGLVGAWLVLVP